MENKTMSMTIGNTTIDETFAEAFRMVYSRLIITAVDEYWLGAAVGAISGYGTSVIGCDAEVGHEYNVLPEESPDGRPGVAILLFGFSQDRLEKAVMNRVAQAVMTCPSTAAFNGLLSAPVQMRLGDQLRFFGDGYQTSKLVGERRFWRIPVMDGEFIVEGTVGLGKGIAGGNFLIQSETERDGLGAARRAVTAIRQLTGVILPFPGGVVRSGSKVGSKYTGLKASTNHEYCPTLRNRTETKLAAKADVVHEIVINGVDERSVRAAMACGIRASLGSGVVAISAGNYGGKLGKFHFYLHDVLGDEDADLPA
jgi:formylmethanofuran--tetrahydromethanopterin N-formyltransferase